MSNPNVTRGLRLPGVQLTATLSVALVLMILGLMAVLATGVRTATDRMQATVGFTVLISDGATPAQLSELGRYWQSAPYVRSATFSDADAVMRRYAEMTGDTSDIASELGGNPFLAEFNVLVTPEYAHTDSLDKITAPLLGYPAITDVVLNADMVRELRRTADTAALVLCIVAVALMIISMVLINNTVRLSVYSKRMLINTMKLVGATDSFVRRPFVRRGALRGLVASLIAIVCLGALVWYVCAIDLSIREMLPPDELAGIGVAMLLVGPALCCMASALSANRYLRASYDDLFR